MFAVVFVLFSAVILVETEKRNANFHFNMQHDAASALYIRYLAVIHGISRFTVNLY